MSGLVGNFLLHRPDFLEVFKLAKLLLAQLVFVQLDLLLQYFVCTFILFHLYFAKSSDGRFSVLNLLENVVLVVLLPLLSPLFLLLKLFV
jgi:hypothetical protein